MVHKYLLRRGEDEVETPAKCVCGKGYVVKCVCEGIDMHKYLLHTCGEKSVNAGEVCVCVVKCVRSSVLVRVHIARVSTHCKVSTHCTSTCCAGAREKRECRKTATGTQQPYVPQ